MQVQMQEAGDAQVCIHLDEGTLGLGEEVVDDALGELALSLVLVHLEDLLEGRLVDGIFCAGNRHDAFADFADFAAVHALWRSGQSGVRRGVRRAGASAGAGGWEGVGCTGGADSTGTCTCTGRSVSVSVSVYACALSGCVCRRCAAYEECACDVEGCCAALSWAGSAGLSSAVCSVLCAEG